MAIEKTFIMIKPDAVRDRKTGLIIDRIDRASYDPMLASVREEILPKNEPIVHDRADFLVLEGGEEKRASLF